MVYEMVFLERKSSRSASPSSSKRQKIVCFSTHLLVHSLFHIVYMSLGIVIPSCVDLERKTISYTKYIYVFDSEMRWHWHTWSLLLQKPPAAVTKEAMIIVIIPFSLLDVSKKWVLSFEETVYTSQQHAMPCCCHHHRHLISSVTKVWGTWWCWMKLAREMGYIRMATKISGNFLYS